MDEYAGQPRRLPWPLQYPLTTERTTEDDGDHPPSSFVWPEDSDERVPILFSLSLNEYNVLASTIDVGSDIAYGEDALRVTWLWLRNMRIQVPICSLIIDCLENDTDTQQAIASLIINNELVRNAVNQVAGKGAPMLPWEIELPVSQGCDLDKLFAQTTGIIDQMNINNVDFLEILAAATAPARKLAAAISAIPIIETLPIDDAIDWVAKMQAEIVTNYNSQYTSSLRDTYRCDLFCIAQEKADCELSYGDIKTYFNNRLGAALDPANLLMAIVQYTILGTWAGTTVVDIMMLNQISIWEVAGNWMDINLRTLQAVTKISSNYPDSDWETLCENCPPPPGCEGTWPNPITSFYQGDITGRTGDVYSVSLENDPITGYDIVRTSEYGDWSQGEFLLTEVEVIGATPFQLYAERGDGSILYDGQDVNALNAALPGCVRYFQAVKRFDTGSFSLKMTIET